MNSRTDNLPQTFHIHTIGCKVNQYESQAMRESMLLAGFRECLPEQAADIYIINTCTVTHMADKEARYLAGAFHRANPKARIILAGCYAEKNGAEISALPGVSHVVNNKDKSGIAEMLGGLRAAKRAITDFKGRTKAFVKIQDGCENGCAYCKVPLVRGGLSSKPLDAVVDEVSGLVEKGFREIIPVGICLGAWGKDLPAGAGRQGAGSFIEVLKALERIRGDFRIRLSSIELKYITDEVIEFMSTARRLCRHLHIPLQSGDDDILRKMNRPYTAAGYLDTVMKLRRSIVGIAVTTDIMVGFPAETDGNFSNTVKFVKEMMPARTHIFTFSKRDGTAAFHMKPEIPLDIAKKRHWELKVAALGSSYIYREAFKGKHLDVLVEHSRDKNSGRLTGYSDNYIRMLFDGPDELMGRVVPVRVAEMNLIYTTGTIGTINP